MFGLFKKGGNNHKALTPEGEKISKPISGNVTGELRKALELTAYALENGVDENTHIMTFVCTVDPRLEGDGNSGVIDIDAAFVRGSDASLGDMLMHVGMNDDTFAKAMIAVSGAIRYHKEDLDDFAKSLEKKVEGSIRSGKIKSKTPRGGRGKLNFDSMKEGLAGIDATKLENATDEEIDELLNRMIKDNFDED